MARPEGDPSSARLGVAWLAALLLAVAIFLGFFAALLFNAIGSTPQLNPRWLFHVSDIDYRRWPLWQFAIVVGVCLGPAFMLANRLTRRRPGLRLAFFAAAGVLTMEVPGLLGVALGLSSPVHDADPAPLVVFVVLPLLHGLPVGLVGGWMARRRGQRRQGIDTAKFPRDQPVGEMPERPRP